MRRRVVARLAAVGIAVAVLPSTSASGGPRSAFASEAAQASRPRQARLALVQLQPRQLGAWLDTHLRLAHDSGPVSNAAAARRSFTGSRGMFGKLGRAGGYILDYGDAYSGASSATNAIQSYVEEYKTRVDAKRGLAFWKRDIKAGAALLNNGITYSVAFDVLSVPALGSSHYSYSMGESFGAAGPFLVIDEWFTDGRYLLEVKETSEASGPSGHSVPVLARMLDRRLHLAFAGRLHGSPPKLPSPRKPGPAKGAPALTSLVLQSSDLGGGGTNVKFSGYHVDPFALSDYRIAYEIADGKYDSVRQEIEWYPSSVEAEARTPYAEALATGLLGAEQTAAVNLNGIGWGALGTISQIPRNGETTYLAVIGLWRGRANDVVLAESQSQIQAADVQSLAQSMADRLSAVPCQTCTRHKATKPAG